MQTPWRRRLEKLFLTTFYIGLNTVVLFLLLEMGARIFIEEKPLDFGALEADEDSLDYSYFDWRTRYFEDLEKPGGGFVYEPYSLWKHSDKKTESFNVQNGYRLTWEPGADPNKKDFLVFMLGASTLYGQESPDEYTIASILAKRLNETSGNHRYVVRNYGVQGFVSDNEVHLLTKLLRAGKRPDAVIFYDGINEVRIKTARGNDHAFEGAFRQNLFRPVRMGWRELGRQLSYRSHLVWNVYGRAKWEEALLPPIVEDRAAFRRNADVMLRNYEQNVLLVRALGKEYGFHTRFFWQPSMYNTAKTLTSEEKTRTTSGVNQLSYEVFADLAEEQDFFELTGVIDISHALDQVTETVFVDSGHITPLGNEAVVDAMLPHLDEFMGDSVGNEQRLMSQLSMEPGWTMGR
jgi:lysophospholipase L1-like esterase